MKEYCDRKSCEFWKDPEKGTPNSCDYLMITGRSRIAQIKDKRQRRDFGSCPCYSKGRRKWRPRQKLPYEMRATYDWSLGTRLYRAGASDREIAAELGCSPSGVMYWRRKMGLPANGGVGKEILRSM